MTHNFTSEHFKRRSDVRFRLIDREAVVLRQEAGETLVLNEVGARILELIEAGHGLDAVAENLVADFEVEPEQALRDANEFAGELLDAGVIEVAPPDGENA